MPNWQPVQNWKKVYGVDASRLITTYFDNDQRQCIPNVLQSIDVVGRRAHQYGVCIVQLWTDEYSRAYLAIG